MSGVRLLRSLTWFACLTLGAVTADEPTDAGGGLPPAVERSVDYSRDIRPILEQRCHSCHGAEKRRGGLRLDNLADALAGGDSGPAFEPGRSGESLLIERVTDLDPDSVMPQEGERLSREQIGLLRAWIDQGADWPAEAEAGHATGEHWAFRKPRRPEPPEVRDRSWPRNDIDRFVLARLEREGLSPAPEADRPTLMRRLHLDLTGLPPTPEEVDAFVANPSPDAYERAVDRLLASPHYGELWARRWLDLARYADTNGYEKDRERSIWPYRDWVIRALNADLPFDRFTIEQVAGDLLPGATIEQKVATGFHRNTMINEEGGIDVEEFRFASIVDRVATTGTVWLGLTIGCAQCHTHKYDPITQREYYQLFAFLNNADEPEIGVPDPALTAKRATIEAQIRAYEADQANQFPAGCCEDGPNSPTEDRRRAHLEAKMAEWERSLRPVNWTMLTPTRLVSRKHATLTVLDDQSVLATGDRPNNDTYEVELPTGLRGITALRLEVLPHESLPVGGPGRCLFSLPPLFSVGDFILTELKVAFASSPGPGAVAVQPDPSGPAISVPKGRDAGEPGPSDRRPVEIADASQDACKEGRPASLAIDGITDTGWTVVGGSGRPHAAVFEFAQPIDGGEEGARLIVTLEQHTIHQMTIGRFRLSVTTDPRPVRATGLPAGIEVIGLVPPELRTGAQARRIKEYYLSVAPELGAYNERIAEMRRSMPKYPTTLVMRERAPEHRRTTRIHKRGEFLKPAETVEPGVPAALHPLPEDAPRDRLGLAHWLVDEDNPLVARVAMNRAWHAIFGRGLVATTEDFGTRGERPTHPELLDWLATEFLRRGWSQKAMHRLIVTSATYRQSSRLTPELAAREPRNELLARGPRLRVEAEAVRDIALAAGGLLTRDIGGPSVHPPQPASVTALAYGMTTWPTSVGPARYRRGLYTFLKRTAPYAAAITFDAPTSETACPRRERSNTPLQALTLMNDAVFVEAAQALARRVLREAGPDTSSRVVRAFRLCLARVPSDEERSAVAGFYDHQLTRFRAGELDAAKVAGCDPTVAASTGPEPVDIPEIAAWTTVARALLNLDETITKE